MQTHDHIYKKTHRLGNWGHSPDRELMYAYDEYVNICTECGNEKAIKTSHRGKLTKSASGQPDIEKVALYPAKWRSYVEQLLRMRRRTIGDIEFVLASALKQSGMRWSEMQECVDRLLKDGIVEWYEFFPKRPPDMNKIIIRSDIVAHLRQALGLNEPNAVKENIDYFFQSWEYPDGLPEAALTLAQVIDIMKRIWTAERTPAFIDAENIRREIKSLSNYMLILDTVKEMLNIVIAGEYIGFRELSVRLTGDSKQLTVIKPYLKLAFESLEPFGVVEHSPLLYCRMPVAGTVEDRTMELDLCHDYFVLTMETARAFRPVVSRMKKLILIENQTPFEKCAKLLKATANDDTGVIFVSGYPPGHIRDFVKKLLRFNPFEGLIWCDLDPDGIQIALTISDWFKENCRTILMEKEHIHASNSKALTTRDIRKIVEIRGIVGQGPLNLSDLLNEMATTGRKVEQEAQIFPLDLLFISHPEIQQS